MIGHKKKSASWVTPKWMKSNEHREKDRKKERKRRAKVSVNNGQYILHTLGPMVCLKSLTSICRSH